MCQLFSGRVNNPAATQSDGSCTYTNFADKYVGTWKEVDSSSSTGGTLTSYTINIVKISSDTVDMQGYDNYSHNLALAATSTLTSITIGTTVFTLSADGNTLTYLDLINYSGTGYIKKQ